ncbi:MAG: hotdog fold domain-containing protein [Mizugakiibacter sp.]|uniref:hotdog fold domain-containing protein n=1 Tax=Mizugakiibacter sp. TaxID=1972610 RepID=UPI0031C63AAC|nr:DUF4442 domain-containing protein [Xanthomonadaceae bacterium]
MAPADAPLLRRYRALRRWPGGAWLFSRLVCLRAPYFASIAPRVERLAAETCEVAIRDRRAVRNHIGTVHAIALCAMAELAAGLLAEAGLPPGMRWIPKGMSVEYLAKARGRMRATAVFAEPPRVAAEGYALPVEVMVRDPAGAAVFRARIAMWVSPRPGVAARDRSSA